MEFLHDLTIKKLHLGLLTKKFTAVEVTQAFFRHIKNRDGEIGAYLSLNEEQAIRTAEETDIQIAKNDAPIALLAGVPIAIKDNILVEKLPATAGSKMLESYRASYSATVIKKIDEAKGVILGKTNMDEFAMGSSTENSAFQKTKNPHDTQRVPGGSSGGSAAAVSATLAVAALGSDTGGSIRQPAAFCGVVGLKPTYGAVSRHGVIAMASSLDQIGPLTKTVEDAKILFDVIKGKDTYDATSTQYPNNKNPGNATEAVKKIRVGIPKEYFIEGLENAVSDAVQKVIRDFKGLQVSFEEVSLPHTPHALSCYYIIMPAEVSANLARFDGIRYARLSTNEPIRAGKSALETAYLSQRACGFGAETQRRILLGTFVLSSGYHDAYYGKAQKVRALITRDFKEVFKKVDVLLAPTTPTRAFAVGEKSNDPLAMYLSDIFTIPANLAGLPAISIPVKAEEGLPIGFQLIGKHFHEDDLLNLGMAYESLYAPTVQKD
jgi:aspartyl-tRNA(Asn)/glutamyl-tRNA(Gln) amidotransferase subunit A